VGSASQPVGDVTVDPAGSSAHAPRSRASDRVLAELRRLIVTLELPPGAVATEESLCARLNCSRTPLREALRTLSREHLVVSVPHRGVSISELSIAGFSNLMEATVGVEAYLLRLCAARITSEQLAQLEDVVSASEDVAATGDLAQVAELDYHFHHLLGKAADNVFLSEMQDTLHRLAERFVFMGFRRAGTPAGAIADHRRIIAALRTRDPDSAELALREHMHNARERMRAAL
jgi:DNA-binding GntR family transcriptional regulator